MKLFLSLYLPSWPIDRALAKIAKTQHNKQSSLPAARLPHYLALITKVAGEDRIAAASTAAAQRGVTPGMPEILARARCPELVSVPFEYGAEYRALYRLARWGLWLSPVVGFESTTLAALRPLRRDAGNTIPDPARWGFIADISGTESVHNGWRSLVQRLSQRCARAGLDHHIAIAPTIGAAWALSRYGPRDTMLTDRADIPAALAPLPVAALRLDNQTVALLNELGLTTIATVQQIPTTKLTSRFRAQLLMRLDQAYGRAPEVLRCVRAKHTITASQTFEIPLDNQELAEQALTSLALTILKELAAQQRVSHCLELTVLTRSIRNERTTQRHEIHLLHPDYNPKQLALVLRSFFERHPLPSAIIRLTMTAQNLRASLPRQQTTIAESDGAIVTTAQNTLAHNALLNLFSSRLGPQSVQRVQFRESHQPERSFLYQPVMSADAAQTVQTPRRSVGRPTQLFDPPEPIRAIALLPDYAPAEIIWRQKRYRIHSGVGPERIATEWWNTAAEAPTIERDYFKLQLESGLWLWVFRIQPHAPQSLILEWFIHGIWS